MQWSILCILMESYIADNPPGDMESGWNLHQDSILALRHTDQIKSHNSLNNRMHYKLKLMSIQSIQAMQLHMAEESM